MSKGRYITDFTSGDIAKKMLVFALPLFLSNLMQAVYNMVDMVVVGQYAGAAGLSAIAIGGDITNMLTFLAMGFSNAGQVIIAQQVGAGNRDVLGKVIGNLMTFLFGTAIVLGTVTFILRGSILSVMNTPPESWQYAFDYVTVCVCGLPFIYGYNFISAVLRGLGDSRHPFIFVATAAVLNLILDIIFVAHFHMGAFGAALATVIGQGVSFFWGITFLLRRREQLGYQLDRRCLRLDGTVMKNLVRLGLPMAIKNASVMFSKMFVNSWINSYGIIPSSAAGIYSKFNVISNLFSNAVNVSTSTAIGQNIGAERYDRVPKALRTTILISATVAAFLTGAVLLFPRQIFGIFTSQPEVLDAAMMLLPMFVFLFIGTGSRTPSNGLINGSGNYKLNFAVAILDGFILRIGFSLLFGLVLPLGWPGFLWGDIIAGFTPFVIFVFYYFSGTWKTTKYLLKRKQDHT